MIRIVLFDMDGVIFSGPNFWLDLHRAFGTEAEGQRLADELMNDDYDELARRVCTELWRGRPARRFEQLVAGRPYEPGVRETIAGLKERSIRTAIVTAGPAQLAQRAIEELGIDAAVANTVETEGGVVSGCFDIRVPNAKKDRVARRLLDEAGFGWDEAASVGDSANDVAIARLAALPISYASESAELDGAAHAALAPGELIRVLDLIDAFNERAAAGGQR